MTRFWFLIPGKNTITVSIRTVKVLEELKARMIIQDYAMDYPECTIKKFDKNDEIIDEIFSEHKELFMEEVKRLRTQFENFSNEELFEMQISDENKIAFGIKGSNKLAHEINLFRYICGGLTPNSCCVFWTRHGEGIHNRKMLRFFSQKEDLNLVSVKVYIWRIIFER